MPELPADIVELLKKNELISAVRALRARFDLPLKSAMEMVNEWQDAAKQTSEAQAMSLINQEEVDSGTGYYYVLEKRPIPSGGFISTAAVWSCTLCGGAIAGMGGPGHPTDLCGACGDRISSGQVRMVADSPAP